MVAQKVHETGVPQAAQEHAATARDTVANTAAQARDAAVEQAAAAREMAAQKYDELSAEVCVLSGLQARYLIVLYITLCMWRRAVCFSDL